MKTLECLWREGTELLKEAGIQEARLDAWLLLEFAAGKTRAYYYAHSDEAVQEEAQEAYLSLVRKRALRIPLQHLTHQAFFMGYEFYVDEAVLIPRQDTEILVEEALKRLEGRSAPEILDMCTGSGCILLSILAENPSCTGVGADISEAALQVAKKNGRRLGLEEKAVFVQSDLFSADYFWKTSGKGGGEYDILISNPPYIPTGEIGELMEEVRLHDPTEALDGKEDGLYFYREITRCAQQYLKPGGWLLYEIGCSQAAAVAEIMKNNGFPEPVIRKDLAGLDRVILGRKPD